MKIDVEDFKMFIYWSGSYFHSSIFFNDVEYDKFTELKMKYKEAMRQEFINNRDERKCDVPSVEDELSKTEN